MPGAPPGRSIRYRHLIPELRRGERATIVAKSDNSFGVAWFVLVVSVIVIQLVGAGYRGLRFANNYDVTTAPMLACTKRYDSQQNMEWYEFEIRLAGVDYPISVIDDASPRRWGWAMFRRPPPRFDWCGLEGRTVTAYHYEPVRAGILFEERPEARLGLFALLGRMEGGGARIGVVLLAALGVVATIAGIVLLVAAAGETLAHVALPRGEGFAPSRLARLVNDLVVPFLSWLLASMLAVVLGAILVKGMLFVETRFDFVSGLVVVAGAMLATLAPAGLVKLVYAVKTTRNEWIKLLGNVLTIAAFTPLAASWYQLLVAGDFAALGEEGLLAFLYGVLTSVLP